MKSETPSTENKNKLHKIDKINKKAKTIQAKSYNSNSFKQRGVFNSSSMTKYNNSLSNTKKDENNNSSILNSQKKGLNQPNKCQNSKQNKFPINKKLNIIKEADENQNITGKHTNNKNVNQRNNNKIIVDKNKSYVVEEKRKNNSNKTSKKEADPILLKKLSLPLHDDNKSYEKFSSSKFKASKSNNIEGITHEKHKKEKDHNKNNNIINDINAKKSKLKKLLDAKKIVIQIKMIYLYMMKVNQLR